MSCVRSGNQLPASNKKAMQLAIELLPHEAASSRSFKLVLLRILILAKFKERQTFVTYSFLMKEMQMPSYLELIALLVQLANQDIDNNDPTVDSLVANDGDDMPPAGHFQCSVKGRSILESKADFEKYHGHMMQMHCQKMDTQLRAVPVKIALNNGKTMKLIPMTRYLKYNPAALLTHSGRRYTQEISTVRRVA